MKTCSFLSESSIPGGRIGLDVRKSYFSCEKGMGRSTGSDGKNYVCRCDKYCNPTCSGYSPGDEEDDQEEETIVSERPGRRPWVPPEKREGIAEPKRIATTYQRTDLIAARPKVVERTGSECVWSYAMTTVPSRIKEGLTQRTLESLASAGFNRPTLFVDGQVDLDPLTSSLVSTTIVRERPARTAGNWYLTLAELWVRNPLADRYAIFQDDFVTVRGLREYLSRPMPAEKCYLNLYTFPRGEPRALRAKGLTAPDDGYRGWYASDQLGKGAVALVFDREGARELLTSSYMIDRFADANRGHKSIDGGIVTAMTAMGWREFVHTPSLTQHTGDESSMGNVAHRKAETFPGEDFNATILSN